MYFFSKSASYFINSTCSTGKPANTFTMQLSRNNLACPTACSSNDSINHICIVFKISLLKVHKEKSKLLCCILIEYIDCMCNLCIVQFFLYIVLFYIYTFLISFHAKKDDIYLDLPLQLKYTKSVTFFSILRISILNFFTLLKFFCTVKHSSHMCTSN